jgi:hypothetical protein
MSQSYLPVRLKQDLILQQVGDETLLYDERRHMAFCLNRIAAAVWNSCDGAHDVKEIADEVTLLLAHPVSADVVELALEQLGKDGLLSPSATAPCPGEIASITRRNLLARAGAGAVMLLPVVAAVMAPKAAQAYNGCVNCTAVPEHNEEPWSPADDSDH